MSDVTWPQAGGNETLHSITLSTGDVFVRPDWNAYDMGYSACRDDMRRALLDYYRVAPKAAKPLLRILESLPPKEEAFDD
jgi:hypothetical protein